jgi:octaprenyl-diphosphate synthase
VISRSARSVGPSSARAIRTASIAASAPSRRARALARFGYHFGLAFQIVGDVLDYSAADAKWGKQVGKDFLEGKTTLPLILAYQKADPDERARLAKLFHKANKTQKDFARLMTLLEQQNALAEAREEACRRVGLAKRSLAAFPPVPARQALCDLAEFVVERTR